MHLGYVSLVSLLYQNKFLYCFLGNVILTCNFYDFLKRDMILTCNLYVVFDGMHMTLTISYLGF